MSPAVPSAWKGLQCIPWPALPYQLQRILEELLEVIMSASLHVSEAVRMAVCAELFQNGVESAVEPLSDAMVPTRFQS